MAAFKKLLIPNRYDSYYIALGVICWLAIVTPILAQLKSWPIIQSSGLIVSVASVVGCLVAVGAVAAGGRIARRRIFYFFAVVGLVNAAGCHGYFWLQENPQLARLFLPVEFGAQFQRLQHTPFTINVSAAGICILFLLAPILAWVIFLGLNWGFAKLRMPVKSGAFVTRPRLLMGFAGILFVVAIVNNILRATIANYDQMTMEFLGGLLGWSIVFTGFIVLVYLPTRVLLGRSPKWLKFLISSLPAISIVPWFFVFQSSGFDPETFVFALATIFGALMYVLSLFGLNEPRKIFGASATDFRTVQPVTSRFQKIPSLWCGLYLMFLYGITWMPFRYDPTTLLLDGDFDLARRESMLRWNSKGQISRIPVKNNCFVFNFDETTDRNILEHLQGDSVDGGVLSFIQAAPQVDLRLLKKRNTLFVTAFSAGEVTTEQLGDVFSQPVTFATFSGCDLVDGGQPFHPASIKVLSFYYGDGDPKIGKILSAFASFDKVNSISIRHKMWSKDWSEVARASQATNVTIKGQLPTDLTPEQMGLAHERLLVESNYSLLDGENSLSVDLQNWLLHSRVSFAFSFRNSTIDRSNLDWDLIYAFPRRFRFAIGNSNPNFGDLLGASESNHFVFERDPNGNPIGVCLPLGESQQQVSDLTELKTLSFDECWVQQRLSNAQARPLMDLTGLTKLEHLAFSESTLISHLDFLLGMKSLKYLQIPNVDRTIQPGIGFDLCPSLESITILGIPDAISVQEFQRLPSLKQLTIVDVFGKFEDENPDSIDPDVNTSSSPTSKDYLQSLTDKLPNVQIVLVPDEEFSPQLPVAFQQHLDSRKSALREKLFASPVSDEELDKH